MHVARIRGSHVDKQGRRRDYESRYLRRTYRDRPDRSWVTAACQKGGTR